MAETSNRAGEKGTIVQIIGAVVDVEFKIYLPFTAKITAARLQPVA